MHVTLKDMMFLPEILCVNESRIWFLGGIKCRYTWQKEDEENWTNRKVLSVMIYLAKNSHRDDYYVLCLQVKIRYISLKKIICLRLFIENKNNVLISFLVLTSQNNEWIFHANNTFISKYFRSQKYFIFRWMLDLNLFVVCNAVSLLYSADEKRIIFLRKINLQNEMRKCLQLLYVAFDLWNR